MRNIAAHMAFAALEEAGVPFEIDTWGSVISKRSFEQCAPWKLDKADERTLFVVQGAQGIEIARMHGSCSFAVITFDDVAAPANTVIVRTRLSAAALASKINSAIKPAIRWIDDMQAAILKGASIQDLFDISEPVLQNWTVMADNAFRLIAYTRNVDVDDEVCLSLVEHGCHDPETMRKLLSEHSLVLLVNRDEQGYSSDRPALRYPSIAKTFVRDGREAEHILQVENKVPLTAYRRELFSKFVEHVELLVNLNVRQGKGPLSPRDELLLLLSDYHADVTSRRGVHLSRTTGIAFDRSFMVGFADFSISTPGVIEGSVSFFERSVPGCFATARDDRVIVLVHARSLMVEENVKGAWTAVSAYLRKHGGHLFLSSPCYACEDLPRAFHQAEMVSMLDEQVVGSDIALFSELMVDWMMVDTEHDEQFLAYCIGQRPFGRMVKEEKPAIVKMVRAYLEGERRATPVGKQLGVHRNSLLYQIERIERQYGVDFDDPSVCFEFRFLFRYIALYPTGFGLLKQSDEE